jgi:sugar lactone lactonase YvrE
VHGKKKHVKVCKTVKPKPTPAPTATSAPPALDDPLGAVTGVTVGPDGNIYVGSTPPNASVGRIVKLSPDGAHLEQFLASGSDDPGSAHYAVDQNGDVYAAEWKSLKVVEYAPDGSVLRQWPVKDDPEAIALDAQGNVYVSQFDLGTIDVFSPAGTLLRTIGPKAGGDAFKGQSFNTITGIAIGADGMLYAVDHRNSRIVKMTLDGTWLVVWGPNIPGLDGGFSPWPEGNAVDVHGNVYVNDGRIVEISPQGQVVRIVPLDFGPNGIKFVGVAPDGTMYTPDDPLHKRDPSGKIIASFH